VIDARNRIDAEFRGSALMAASVVTTEKPRWRPVSGNDPVLRPTAGATTPSVPPPPW
jgi:hypothetical protein